MSLFCIENFTFGVANKMSINSGISKVSEKLRILYLAEFNTLSGYAKYRIFANFAVIWLLDVKHHLRNSFVCHMQPKHGSNNQVQKGLST